MIERWLLAIATLLAAIAGLNAWRAVIKEGRRSGWTLPLLAATFIVQLMALGIRGEVRGACPLSDFGEVLAFLAWSLVLFYLVVGPAYHVSLLGLFTAPLVVLLQGIALIPGVMTWDPPYLATADPWKETHAALSVLSFGALALSAVSALMFLQLDRLLKRKKMLGGLFKNLPSIHNLLDCTRRLLLVGTIILTVGIVAGFLAPNFALNLHFIVACVVWVTYLTLVAFVYIRGLPPVRLCVFSCCAFFFSLLAFGLI